MNSTEKEIVYTISNSYTTLNSLTSITKNVIFACHGMGYLSRYFLKYFKGINSDDNYIIIPQAQSKYYIAPKMKHVGASWLTKENTLKEMENINSYFDSVLSNEKIENLNFIFLGYSQGVSVAMRYLAKRKIIVSKLILMSGGIPKELTPKDFKYLKNKAAIYYIYGDKDEYITEDFLNSEKKRFEDLFSNINYIEFDGNHEIKTEIIESIIN
jgi:predicted esterase